MYEFTRVKDKATGHEYSVRYVDPDQHEVIDKPAVDLNGDALPGKPNKTPVATKAAAKNEEGSK